MPAPSQAIEMSASLGERPRIGMLWGDFPWAAPPRKLNKMLSMGVTARNLTRALGLVGQVVPYQPPPLGASPTEQRAALTAFLSAIDVLWADVYPLSGLALRLRQELKLDCPAILFAAGAMPKGAEAMLFPWQGLLDQRDSLLFTCQADQAIWRRLTRWSRLREYVMPLLVDETVFRPRTADERTATRAQHGLPLDAPLLLYVGRLNIQKNLHTLLRLLARVRQAAPTAHLCLVGADDDIKLGEFGVHNTGYVAWLRALAEELGVAEGVTWAGSLMGEDLARVYAAADVLVNLGFYHRENFGLAQAEAHLCGVPVVCTAWGGFKDIVAPGETGYLVDAVLTKRGIRVDWATAADHALRLLGEHALWRTMSHQAAVWAQERFTITSLAPVLADIVTTALQPSVSMGGQDQTMEYQPSRFAQRYEAHKRACGWYAVDRPGGRGSESQRKPPWYPPMFQGRDYALYETLMEPYASRRADDLTLDMIQPVWVPYCPSPLVFDPVRRLVHEQDPVWPQRRFLDQTEWDVLRRVDGTATILQITTALAAADPSIPLADTIRILRQFHVEGLVLFQH